MATRKTACQRAVPPGRGRSRPRRPPEARLLARRYAGDQPDCSGGIGRGRRWIGYLTHPLSRVLNEPSLILTLIFPYLFLYPPTARHHGRPQGRPHRRRRQESPPLRRRSGGEGQQIQQGQALHLQGGRGVGLSHPAGPANRPGHGGGCESRDLFATHSVHLGYRSHVLLHHFLYALSLYLTRRARFTNGRKSASIWMERKTMMRYCPQ